MSETPLRLLLVEDNEADVFFFREAVRETRQKVELHVRARADHALEFLAEAPCPEALPQLIVLDLNLPRVTGLEMLDALREVAAWARIPTVVLSSSKAPSDVAEAYRRGARAHLVKPMDYERLAEMVAAVIAFWRQVLPAPPGPGERLR
jgi:CheY-like chemotaxis protein